MKNLLYSLLWSGSVPKSRVTSTGNWLGRLRGFEHALLLWRSKIAATVIPAERWPRCPFCDGSGAVPRWEMIDEDEWEPQEVMCEGCEATGRISPSHLQEYEIAISPVRDVVDLCEPPF